MTQEPVEKLAQELRDIMHSFTEDGLGAVLRLAPLYDPDVLFRDPLQTLHGKAAFLDMNRRIVTRARHIAFDVQEAEGAGGSLFLTWTMEYRAKVGPMLVFEGVTHFRIRGGLIVEHRDYWDLLSSVVATVPGLRSLYAALTPHLA